MLFFNTSTQKSAAEMWIVPLNKSTIRPQMRSLKASKQINKIIQYNFIISN